MATSRIGVVREAPRRRRVALAAMVALFGVMGPGTSSRAEAAVAVPASAMTASAMTAGARAAATVAAADSVRVWATLSADEITVGTTTILEVHIETSGARPEEILIPTLHRELDIVSTGDFTQTRFSLPGGRSRLVRREVILRPRSPGSYTIPPISVSVAGTRFQTRSLELHVADAPRVGDGLGVHGPDDEIIFRASLDADTVYVGEQLTVRADILVSDEARIRLRRSPEYLPPNASGFWVHDFDQPAATSLRTIGPRRYRMQTLARAYFPLSAGEFTFPPARLVYEIRRGLVYSPQVEELRGDSMRVVVLPLPAEGMPDGFSGAVGRFEVRSRLEPEEIPAGEAVALTVELQGRGNIRGLPPPKLPELPGVEVHPPSEESHVETHGTTVTGTKRFTWVLVAHEPGTLRVPPIEYAYFDPDRRSYAVARSEPMSLTVLGSAAPAEEVAAPPAAPVLRDAPSGDARFRWVRGRAFAALQFLPLVVMVVILLRGRGTGPSDAPSRRTLRKRWRAELDALREQVELGDADFFRELDGTIRDAISARIGAPVPRSTSPAEIAVQLNEHGVERATVAAITALLGRIEQARFAARSPSAAARVELIDVAEDLLENFDRQARRPTHAALLLSLAAMGALGFMASPAHAAEVDALDGRIDAPDARIEALDRDFEEGIERYGEGDYVAAARAFTRFLDRFPHDANGWYNLGSAYHQAGERGRAAWAWLQAHRLRPRDADVRSGLARVGVDPRLVRQASPLAPLSNDEALLAAAVAWLLGSSLVVSYTLTRRRRRAAFGAASIMVAMTMLGAWAGPRVRAPVGIVLPADAMLLAAPTPRAEPVAGLAGGDGVRIVDRRGVWLRVRGLHGAEGWIEAVEIGPLRGIGVSGSAAER